MLVAFIGILFIAAPCWAHKVNVFAYVEGDKIVVQGYFTKDRKAMNCVVQIFDAQGKELHKGKTDRKGQYAVPIADLGTVNGDVLITLVAGEGHKRNYRLSADELPKNSKSVSKTSRPERPAPGPDSVKTTELTQPVAHVQDLGTLEKAIETIVKRENEKIVKMLGNQQKLLLEQRNSGPTLKDIVGGIGWILGIVGVIAFFLGRTRNH